MFFVCYKQPQLNLGPEKQNKIAVLMVSFKWSKVSNYVLWCEV